MIHSPRRLQLVVALCLALPFASQAVEWTAEPRITSSFGYSDNPNLSSSTHNSAFQASVAPKVDFRIATPRQGIVGDVGFKIQRFSRGSGNIGKGLLDREDYHLRTNTYHNSARSSVNIGVDYTVDSAQDSELSTGNFVRDRTDRTRLTLSPTWTQTLTPLTRLRLGLVTTMTEYPDKFTGSTLVDSDSASVSANLDRQITPRLTGNLSASLSRFEPDTGFNSDTTNLQAGVTWNYDETLTTSFQAGVRNTETDSIAGSGLCIGADPGATFPTCTGGFPINTGISAFIIETTGAVFTASINKTLEAGSFSATLSRSSRPSSEGELLDSTRLVLEGEHRFTETLRTLITAEYTVRETIINRSGGIANEEDDILIRIKPKIVWRWRRDMEVSAEYGMTQEDDASSGVARRNLVLLTYRYIPRRITVSR